MATKDIAIRKNLKVVKASPDTADILTDLKIAVATQAARMAQIADQRGLDINEVKAVKDLSATLTTIEQENIRDMSKDVLGQLSDEEVEDLLTQVIKKYPKLLAKLLAKEEINNDNQCPIETEE